MREYIYLSKSVPQVGTSMAMVAPTSLITPIGIARRSSLSRSLRKNFLSLWSEQVNRPIPQRTGACLPAEDLYSSKMIDSFLNRSRQIFLLIDHCKPFYASLPLFALNPKEEKQDRAPRWFFSFGSRPSFTSAYFFTSILFLHGSRFYSSLSG